MSSHATNDSIPTQEEQLLARVAQGEQAALGELYDRWCQPLQARASAFLKDPSQIEDTLFKTFITLWEKAGDFDPKQGSAYDWAATWVRVSSASANPAPNNANAARSPETAAPDHLAPHSAALRARILNSAVALPSQVPYRLPFPPPPAWVGWGLAALCALAALFFCAKSFNVRGELQAALESERVTRLEAGTLKNLLEAERILSRAQLERLLAAERLNAELSAKQNPSVQQAPR